MELSQLRAFVAVLDSGSLLQASRALEVSRTTLQSRLAALEDSLGVELLVRTHRGVEPTEFGRKFAEGARVLLRDAESLARSTARHGTEVLGELHVRASIGFPPQVGAMFASRVAMLYPNVDFILELEGDPTREPPPEVDVILYFGEPPISGAFRTFNLLRVAQQLLASRAYLDTHGSPRDLDELRQHRLGSWMYPGFDGRRWPLCDGSELDVAPAFLSNHVYCVRELAARGQLIALLPNADVAVGTVPGEDFEVVLPELVGREAGVWVLLPEAQATTPRSRAAVKLLRELSQGILCKSI
ncbi:MAG: LysR family transcriptional regulator [Enhygromyxa sp.]